MKYRLEENIQKFRFSKEEKEIVLYLNIGIPYLVAGKKDCSQKHDTKIKQGNVQILLKRNAYLIHKSAIGLARYCYFLIRVKYSSLNIYSRDILETRKVGDWNLME